MCWGFGGGGRGQAPTCLFTAEDIHMIAFRRTGISKHSVAFFTVLPKMENDKGLINVTRGLSAFVIRLCEWESATVKTAVLQIMVST